MPYLSLPAIMRRVCIAKRYKPSSRCELIIFLSLPLFTRLRRIKGYGLTRRRGVAMSMSILEKYNPMMFLINGRNQLVDAFFYDISSLTAKEWVSLTSTVDRKGEIIVVSPGKHKQPIRHYTHPLEFILKEREHVQAIGSSGGRQFRPWHSRPCPQCC